MAVLLQPFTSYSLIPKPTPISPTVPTLLNSFPHPQTSHSTSPQSPLPHSPSLLGQPTHLLNQLRFHPATLLTPSIHPPLHYSPLPSPTYLNQPTHPLNSLKLLNPLSPVFIQVAPVLGVDPGRGRPPHAPLHPVLSSGQQCGAGRPAQGRPAHSAAGGVEGSHQDS